MSDEAQTQQTLLHTLGVIQSIEEVNGVTLPAIAPTNGVNGARLGFLQMINVIGGAIQMEGYVVTTDEHVFRLLIDSEQSCCENFGHFASEDDLTTFVGATLYEVRLTDTALHQEVVEQSDYYGTDDDGGGIQFVDFATDRGVFQLAVYNDHNGYYGHGILVVKDDDILLNDTL